MSPFEKIYPILRCLVDKEKMPNQIKKAKDVD